MHEELNGTCSVDAPDYVSLGGNPNGPKVHMATFGCQMNKLDTEIVEGDLLQRGYQFVGQEDDADIIIYNTCSVRQKAENRLYGRLAVLGSARAKQGRDIVVGIMGCVAQQEKDTLFESSPAVRFVVGTGEYNRVGEILDLIRGREKDRILAVELDREFGYERNPAARPVPWQAYISAMRGCDKYCTYCVVPFTRGREVSRPLDDILREAETLAAQGVIDITVLGQRIDTYGRDLKSGLTLSRLLRELAAIPGLQRVKFITAHPKCMTAELFETIAAEPKLSRYIHMPAQSGSTEILRKMNRGYTREEYIDTVAMARRILGDVHFSSDFIVGFPDETEEEFQRTVSLMREVRFSGAFVFKYSVRPGTAYEPMGDPIPDAVKKRRNQELLKLQEEIMGEQHRAEHGRRLRVLVDGPSKTDRTRLSGRDHGNRIVIFESGRVLSGRFVDVEITHSTPLTLFGRLV